MLSGNRPLSEPMLTQIYGITRPQQVKVKRVPIWWNETSLHHWHQPLDYPSLKGLLYSVAQWLPIIVLISCLSRTLESPGALPIGKVTDSLEKKTNKTQYQIYFYDWKKQHHYNKCIEVCAIASYCWEVNIAKSTSHYLSQCWPRFLTPYLIARLEWVNWLHWHYFDYVGKGVPRCWNETSLHHWHQPLYCPSLKGLLYPVAQ